MNGFSKGTITIERVGLGTIDGLKKFSLDVHIDFCRNISRYARINVLKEMVYKGKVYTDFLNYFKNTESYFYVEVNINDDIYNFFVSSGFSYVGISFYENAHEEFYRRIEFTDRVIASRLRKEELRGLEYYITLKEKAEYESGILREIVVAA